MRRSIRLSPPGPASFLGLGQTLLRSGKTEEGQRLLERARVLGEQNAQLRPHQDAVRQNPDPPRAHSNLAGLYNRFGRLKLAAEHYRQSIVIDSTYRLGYQGLGNMYQRRGDDAMAARYYFEALRWDSTLAESHNNLGLLLHKKGELEKAIKQYERAVREAPETGFYHSNLGNGYLETDRLDQAQQAAERALAHQTGARCLRYVIEETLLDVMYDLPSLPDVARCMVDRDAIEGTGNPILLTQAGETLNIPLGRISKSA